MLVKTSELTGPALDWAVATCLGTNIGIAWLKWFNEKDSELIPVDYSTDWAYGGPIIEREFIRTEPQMPFWEAKVYDEDGNSVGARGKTLLVAAMRCYVTSKLGDEVDIPDEIAR